MSRVRNFVFTDFVTTAEHREHILTLKVKYICYGVETCPTTNKPHLQGYCELANAKSLSAIKKIFSAPALHIERRKGTAQQAKAYCQKDGEFHEAGTISQQGKRTDINSLYENLENGYNMRDVIGERPMFQHFGIAKQWLTYNEKGRDWLPTIYWFYGESGTGKTRSAMEMFPAAWLSARTLRWWDGYDGHEAVIIDDFRKDFCTYHELLRILDRYAYRVEYKGGYRQLLAKNIIITSCYHPQDVYDTREDLAQLLRRITEIRQFAHK